MNSEDKEEIEESDNQMVITSENSCHSARVCKRGNSAMLMK